MALDEREPLANLAPSHLAAEAIQATGLRKIMGMWLEHREDESRYIELDKDGLTSLIWENLDGRHYLDEEGKVRTLHLKRSSSADVREALVHLSGTRGIDRLPAWLDKRDDDPDPSALLPVANGLLNWRTGELMPPSPRFVNLSRSDVAYDPDADHPLYWEFFLQDIFDGDQEQIDLLHEVLGCIITGQAKFQKVFQIIGPPRSGKGTIGRMLVHLIGAQSVVSPKIRQIRDGGFGLQSLIGRQLAMVTDARVSRGQATDALTEILLTTSGGDLQTIQRKFLADFIGYLGAQWLLMSNEPVLLHDYTGTIATRMVLLETRRGFLGKEDLDLFERDLLPEASGVLNLCLAGARKLADRGRFQTPSSIVRRKKELLRGSSTVAGFSSECLIEDPTAVTKKDEIWEAYEMYCEAHGKPSVANSSKLFEDLRSGGKYREDMDTRPWMDDGDARARVYCVKGLRVDETAIPDIDDLRTQRAAEDF